MPELPEVETIRLGLEQFVVGRTISAITSDWPKGFPNEASLINTKAIGAEIVGVRRRAKVLIIDLDSHYSFAIHLKMTGQLVFRDGDLQFGAGHPNDSLIGELPDRSTRIIVVFNDGSKLFFNDQRKFGWMRLLPTNEVLNLPFLQRVGPEPFDKSFHAQEFINRVRRHQSSSIKAALLDQTTLAGIGNIYADESLFAARIHPARRVSEVTDTELSNLFDEIRTILHLSIEKGGSTDKNYVTAEGKKGSYLSFAQVFRREGQLCFRCGAVIQKTRVAGRGTHFCPVCQKR